MKNKRNVLIAFILICCLCLSIGYAALTDTLTVTGTANLDVDGGTGPNDTDPDGEEDTEWEKAFNADVYFANSSNASVAVISADADGDANDKLTITVPEGTFTPNSRTVSYTVDIKNDSEDYAAEITLNNTTTESFSISCDWTEDDADNIITVAEGFQKVTITITLTDAPDEDVSESFTITFNAKAVDQ